MGQNRIKRPRNVNLQSKLIVFRLRERINVTFDPTNLEGGVIQVTPTFGNLTATEYARGREEAVQFMRTRFAGLSVSIKKTGDDLLQYIGTAAVASNVSKSKTSSRLSFIHDLYCNATQLNTNNVAIDTAAGAVRRIGFRGRKVFKYTVPTHMQTGLTVDAGSFFTSAKPNLDWRALVNVQNNIPAADLSIPLQYFLVLDSSPSVANIGAINYLQTTSIEVFTNYYFKAYGKRVNV